MQLKSKIITTGSSEIWIDEQGILRVKVLEDIDMTYEQAVNCFDAYRELGCGGDNKVLQLMDACVYSTLTKEAREYIVENAGEFFIASAIVTDNVAIRLIANFITKFHKLEVPLKIFDTEEKALEWLLSYRK